MTAKQAEWRDRVRRWRASGLTAGSFAEMEGVSEGTLRHWAWRLGLGRTKRASQATPPAFVEVVTRSVAASELEIVVRDGVRIRVPSEFDDTTLRRVLALLESR